MVKKGIKALTPENWLEPDPVMECFVTAKAEDCRPIKGHEWASRILRHTLGDHVPEEVQGLFEAARGIMVYGYFYYPLFTLGTERLSSALEAAVLCRCRELACPQKVKNLQGRIDWLAEQGVLSDKEQYQLHISRSIRNDVSHPTRQTLLTPGIALGMLGRCAEDINNLFAVPGGAATSESPI
jgi:hypothetical protein